ncbi:MAG: SpoIVB peptidase S55 domain-containing protein [Bacilli bacterium]
MKKLLIFLTIILFPINIFAYSEYVVLGGKTLGIKVDTKGIMVIGFYKVDGKYNKGTPAMENGDYIISVEGNSVNNVNELTEIIEKNIDKDFVKITFIRDGIEKETNLDLININGVIKTGLFVKSSIMGIGTLTYIDPNSLIYGALGHEIVESESNSKVEIKSGQIFNNKITGIEKSAIGVPGSKIAKFNYNYQYGTIFKNTKYGIFGYYKDKIDDSNLIKVSEDVKIGPAQIKTVIDGEKVETFDIEITKINETSDIKNISFKINDENLLDLTGGVVQGMSGSPIVQNDNLIGVLTHVVVDNPYTGYGLFITKMLEEGEK